MFLFSKNGRRERDEFEFERVAVRLRSETMRNWAMRLQRQYGSDSRLEDLAREIEADGDLEYFLYQLIADDSRALGTLDLVQDSITFYREHPDWWSRHFEFPFESITSAIREEMPESLLTEWDVFSGITSGTYQFVKGTVTGVADLIGFCYRFATDSQTRLNAAATQAKISFLVLKLKFGSREQKSQAAREIGAFFKRFYQATKSEMEMEWDKAGTEGKQAKLLSQWVTRGLLEIATIVIPVAKGGKFLKALGESGKALKLSQRALDFGLRLNAQLTKLGISLDRIYVVLRMERFEYYSKRLRGVVGVSGEMEAIRGARKGNFPFYDAHPNSSLQPHHRFHLPGERAVYFGTSKEVVTSEMAKHYGSKWAKNYELQQIKLQYRNALDLTDPKVLKKLGINPAVLYGSDVSHGQVISSIARSMGFDAIIANSAANANKAPNLILLRKEIIR